MQSRSKLICEEVQQFLGKYNRSVIQIKTLKGKLEENPGEQSIFKNGKISVAELREAINGSEMREFLTKDTLTNFVKEGKSQN